jgi:hypothetical protein
MSDETARFLADLVRNVKSQAQFEQGGDPEDYINKMSNLELLELIERSAPYAPSS